MLMVVTGDWSGWCSLQCSDEATKISCFIASEVRAGPDSVEWLGQTDRAWLGYYYDKYKHSELDITTSHPHYITLSHYLSVKCNN